jgi:head-tail adaptor
VIGGLKYQIDLLTPMRAADAGGGALVTWTVAARVFAAVTQLSAIVAQSGGRQTRVERVEARIRRRHAVSLGQRFEWKEKTFEIVSIEDEGAGERYVTLIGEEVR